MISGYITHLDYDKLLKLLDDPDLLCPVCSNKPDCIGKEECFNRENYMYIKITVDNSIFFGELTRDERASLKRVGDSPLSQLDQIDLSLEESDQIQEKENQILGEVD